MAGRSEVSYIYWGFECPKRIHAPEKLRGIRIRIGRSNRCWCQNSRRLDSVRGVFWVSAKEIPTAFDRGLLPRNCLRQFFVQQSIDERDVKLKNKHMAVEMDPNVPPGILADEVRIIAFREQVQEVVQIDQDQILP